MKLNHSERLAQSETRTAMVVSFEAEVRKRQQQRADEAAAPAAVALAEFRAGRAEFRDVIAALIAPFNR
jgi:hypothetical protein